MSKSTFRHYSEDKNPKEIANCVEGFCPDCDQKLIPTEVLNPGSQFGTADRITQLHCEGCEWWWSLIGEKWDDNGHPSATGVLGHFGPALCQVVLSGKHQGMAVPVEVLKALRSNQAMSKDYERVRYWLPYAYPVWRTMGSWGWSKEEPSPPGIQI